MSFLWNNIHKFFCKQIFKTAYFLLTHSILNKLFRTESTLGIWKIYASLSFLVINKLVFSSCEVFPCILKNAISVTTLGRVPRVAGFKAESWNKTFKIIGSNSKSKTFGLAYYIVFKISQLGSNSQHLKLRIWVSKGRKKKNPNPQKCQTSKSH